MQMTDPAFGIDRDRLSRELDRGFDVARDERCLGRKGKRLREQWIDLARTAHRGDRFDVFASEDELGSKIDVCERLGQTCQVPGKNCSSEYLPIHGEEKADVAKKQPPEFRNRQHRSSPGLATGRFCCWTESIHFRLL